MQTVAFIFGLLAVLSLLVGNFSALGQRSVRRLLAFSSISHAGYLLLALNISSVEGEAFIILENLWYYLVIYAISTIGVMTAIAVWADADEGDDFDQLAGAARRHPVMGFAVSVLLTSMAGLPLTAGFIAKYKIFATLVENNHILLAIFGMLIAVLGATYYIRLMVTLWNGEGERVVGMKVNSLSYAVVTITAILAIALAFVTIGPEVVVEDAGEGEALVSQSVPSQTVPSQIMP